MKAFRSLEVVMFILIYLNVLGINLMKSDYLRLELHVGLQHLLGIR